jgi:hypothetical protein
MKSKLGFAISLMALGCALPLAADGFKVSYSFNNGNGNPGSGDEAISDSGTKGYFPLSGQGRFDVSGRSGKGLDRDVMVVGGLPPMTKETPLTISLWVKAEPGSGGGMLVSKQNAADSQGFALQLGMDQTLTFSLTDEFGGQLAVSTVNEVPTDNQWHHVAVTYRGDSNASNVALYIDSQVSDLRLLSDNITGKIETYHPLVLGSDASYQLATAVGIDEFYLVPQAFVAEQVSCLYQLKTDCAYRPAVGQQGPRGPQGVAGLQGPRGVEGDKGATGDQGAKGAAGDKGLTGPKGATGVAGFAGPTGPEGLPGANGTDGADGANGKTGLAGDPGPVGDKGKAGPKGVAGPTGPKGATGARGATGATGAAGARGAAGDKGPPGDRGATGPKGATGLPGANGAAGVTGPQGDPGDVGPPGVTGVKGGIGRSGTNAQRGPQGPAGPQGPQGPQGRNATIQDCMGIYFRTPYDLLSQSNPDYGTVSGLLNALPKSSEVQLDGAIDPEFIVAKATQRLLDGSLSINFAALGIANNEELQAFFAAQNAGNTLQFIRELYQRKGLDNRFAEVAAGYIPVATPVSEEQ